VYKIFNFFFFFFSNPAFVVVSGRKIKPVSYSMLHNFLKKMIEKIGLEPLFIHPIASEEEVHPGPFNVVCLLN
jgi:AAA+ ATPase superfamily predicted ATPase